MEGHPEHEAPGLLEGQATPQLPGQGVLVFSYLRLASVALCGPVELEVHGVPPARVLEAAGKPGQGVHGKGGEGGGIDKNSRMSMN